MNVEVTCPHCRKQYLIKSKFAGRKVKCRHCSHPMQVEDKGARGQGPGIREEIQDPLLNTLFDCREPSDAETKLSFEWEAPSDWLPPPVPVVCFECGKSYQAPAELAGRQIRCRGCGTAVHVPETDSPTVTMEIGG